MADARTRIPRDVLRELRQEVGFVCPVKDCLNPLLTWHHFDPPWRVEHHNRPEGMIALCCVHASQADNGAFTDDQLRAMKINGRAKAAMVTEKMNWMRQDLLAEVGGSFYYKVPIILQIGNTPCVWFNRDEDNNLLLNFRMPTLTSRPRAKVTDNVWSVTPEVHEVISPPSGRMVDVAYGNGDKFHLEFFDLPDADAVRKRWGSRFADDYLSDLTFPLTGVVLYETAAGTSIDFRKNATISGPLAITGGFMHEVTVGMYMPALPEEERRLFG